MFDAKGTHYRLVWKPRRKRWVLRICRGYRVLYLYKKVVLKDSELSDLLAFFRREGL